MGCVRRGSPDPAAGGRPFGRIRWHGRETGHNMEDRPQHGRPATTWETGHNMGRRELRRMSRVCRNRSRWLGMITSLVVCLVLQASAPCCCVLQPECRGDCTYRAHGGECPALPADDCRNSDCRVCSVLGQVFDFPVTNDELFGSAIGPAWPFGPNVSDGGGDRAPAVGSEGDVTALCDIYMLQTLRE